MNEKAKTEKGKKKWKEVCDEKKKKGEAQNDRILSAASIAVQ